MRSSVNFRVYVRCRVQKGQHESEASTLQLSPERHARFAFAMRTLMTDPLLVLRRQCLQCYIKPKWRTTMRAMSQLPHALWNTKEAKNSNANFFKCKMPPYSLQTHQKQLPLDHIIVICCFFPNTAIGPPFQLFSTL